MNFLDSSLPVPGPSENDLNSKKHGCSPWQRCRVVSSADAGPIESHRVVRIERLNPSELKNSRLERQVLVTVMIC